MKIAVAGCGVTGTAVGILLAEQGHEITLLEQAIECRPIGAGIMLQTSGQQILKRMGMLDELRTVSQRLSGMTAQLVSGRNLVNLDFGRLGPDSFALGVHRGRLFEILVNRCLAAGVRIENNFRAARFEAGSGTVESADGQRLGGFDFLIAADGSRSCLRESASIPVSITEYDHAAFWTTGPCDYQPGRLLQIVDGTTRLLGLLPIGLGHSSFFWGLSIRSRKTLLQSGFSAWKSEALEMCPEAASVLDTVDDFEQLTFGTYRSVAMRRCYGDKIIFLGDAAHATSPHLGQGANLALEDAYCFAESLQETKSFPEACLLFKNQRRRKVRFYRQLTALLSPYFQSNSRIKGHLRNWVLPWMPHLPFVGREMIRTLSGQKGGWLG